MTELSGEDNRSPLEAVMLVSVPMSEQAEIVKGVDFNKGVDWNQIMNQYKYMGFQGTNLALAIEEVNRMRNWKPSPEELEANPNWTPESRCKIFLGYTSNMISCGNRDIIRYLVQHKMVDVLVTSAGGIEEDFIKCLAPLYIGDFKLSGSDLRKKGHNRIGNLIMPNNNYVLFEEWLNPILDAMLEEQQKSARSADPIVWSPSSLIHRLGKEINNEESVYYWAAVNDIPVFCPAITDGSLGDMIYFHSFKNPGLVLDLVTDIKKLNSEAVFAAHTGMIILGGGVVKHHICNANLMRNGADFSVFVNTGNEFDGSDSGASPDEAVSWGKIKATANPVKVCADASIIFPLLVACTFASEQQQ